MFSLYQTEIRKGLSPLSLNLNRGANSCYNMLGDNEFYLFAGAANIFSREYVCSFDSLIRTAIVSKSLF